MENFYKVYEASNGIKYLSPCENLLLKLFPKETFIEKELKTTKTISYILLHKNAGNNLDIKNIENTNKPIKELLEELNAFTIKTQSNINHLLKRKTAVEIVAKKQEFIRLPAHTICDMKPNKEEQFLKLHINYYLNKLGLKTVHDNQEIFYYPYSTIGDSLLKTDILLKYKLDSTLKNTVFTNIMQQFALVQLKFHEFATSSTHLGGTFFEFIYYCAKIQGREDISELLLETLLTPFEDTEKEPMQNIIF